MPETPQTAPSQSWQMPSREVIPTRKQESFFLTNRGFQSFHHHTNQASLLLHTTGLLRGRSCCCRCCSWGSWDPPRVDQTWIFVKSFFVLKLVRWYGSSMFEDSFKRSQVFYQIMRLKTRTIKRLYQIMRWPVARCWDRKHIQRRWQIVIMMFRSIHLKKLDIITTTKQRFLKFSFEGDDVEHQVPVKTDVKQFIFMMFLFFQLSKISKSQLLKS